LYFLCWLHPWQFTLKKQPEAFAEAWGTRAVPASHGLLFNFYNRWIDATGVHPMSEEAHRRFAEGTAHNGYIHR
jgi:hypothetical protein